MGVNVGFQTTLARTSQNGIPVLLGSSQARVVSAQDGTASIVPSAGNVGPCDVFITVSAGSSSAQFHMENLAAIVPEQPQNGGAKAPTTRSSPHFGPQTSTPQGAPDMLFAVPEYAPPDDAEASQGPCSGSCQDSDSNPDSNFGANRNAGFDDAVPLSCESAPELPKVEAPAVPAEPSTKAIAPSCR